MSWIDIFKRHKRDVYGSGQALPEPAYETATGRRLYTVHQMQDAYAAGVAAEREACAEVCEGHYDTAQAARAIRTRGEK